MDLIDITYFTGKTLPLHFAMEEREDTYNLPVFKQKLYKYKF